MSKCNHAVSHVDKTANKVMTFQVSKVDCPHCLGVENERLKSINAELVAACEVYVRLIGNCGDPTQYSGSFANLLAAIEKAKQ